MTASILDRYLSWKSGGKTQRGPLSKQRNKHLQRVLIEAAKLAPRWNPQLHDVHEREL